MATERRNLYRILYVQPEAPAEVIKAAYRALMSTLRAHPDLGGDHELAARINAAYAVLSDPEQRRAYDQRLRRPPRGGHSATAAGAPPAADAAGMRTAGPDPAAWLADRCCPFCRQPFAATPQVGARCSRCGAPLTPAPAGVSDGTPGEILGRRRGERFSRDLQVAVRLPGRADDQPARLRDLSFTGLSLAMATSLPVGSALRVLSDQFDTVAQVVACRRASTLHTVHARLLTLHLLRTPRGVYVDAKA